MKIAVIDGGIIPIFKDDLNIIEDLIVNDDNLVVQRRKDSLVITDHGFNVCKIINMYAPDAEIISIGIFNDIDMKTNIDALLSSFKYCLDKKIPIIHLSGGTINLFDDYRLRNVINDIINNNQIIVAAHSNNKSLSFPALYPGVFSVRANELVEDRGNNNWGYSFYMPSKHKIHVNEKLDYVTQIANSYAAPFLTAKIYNILKDKGYSRKSNLFRELDLIENIFICEFPTLLKDVIIVNFSDEIVIKDLLPFEVKDVYNDNEFEIYYGDYIFIPHDNNEKNIRKFKEFIIQIDTTNSNNRIFYLGTINRDIKSIMENYCCEFWLRPDENIYPIENFKEKFFNYGTIYFQGEKESVYRIMVKLNNIFLKDGFNSFPISDYNDAVLYNIYYFKNIESSIRRRQLEYVLEPDVELIYSKNKYMERESNSILINVLEEIDKTKLVIEDGDIKEEIYISCDRDIKNLFIKLINGL